MALIRWIVRRLPFRHPEFFVYSRDSLDLRVIFVTSVVLFILTLAATLLFSSCRLGSDCYLCKLLGLYVPQADGDKNLNNEFLSAIAAWISILVAAITAIISYLVRCSEERCSIVNLIAGEICAVTKIIHSNGMIERAATAICTKIAGKKIPKRVELPQGIAHRALSNSSGRSKDSVANDSETSDLKNEDSEEEYYISDLDVSDVLIVFDRDVRIENYFNIFIDNNKRLGSISAEAIQTVVGFYTHMKAVRDLQRALAKTSVKLTDAEEKNAEIKKNIEMAKIEEKSEKNNKNIEIAAAERKNADTKKKIHKKTRKTGAICYDRLW